MSQSNAKTENIYYRLEVYVPETHLEQVKQAISDAGGGKLGNYDSCMWCTLGTGQFRPLEGSNPYLGQTNKVEKVSEYKIECIIESQLLQGVITSMKHAHPYEVPAYQYWEVKIQ